MKWTVIVIVVYTARMAHAQPCTWLDPDRAARALAVLEGHPSVVGYCEPCGDTAPAAPLRAATSAVHRGPAGLGLTINGDRVDLASIYVQTAPDRYDNLARLVDCPGGGGDVPSLRVEVATDRGVLITPDPTRAPAAPSPLLPAPAASAAPLPPSAPAPVPVLVVAPAAGGLGWGAIGLACLATGAVWLLGGVASRRRRHVPRATELR